MGTTYSVVVYGPTGTRCRRLSSLRSRKCAGWISLLSNYRPESEWSRVNQHAAERPVKVSKELFDLLVRLRPLQRSERRRVRYHVSDR